LRSNSDDLSPRSLRAGAFLPPWLLPLYRDPTLAIRGQISLIADLEELGYDEAWIGEHHSGGMEIIGSPELLIAAAIERTERIRLGTGVISLPYHNPFTVADRIVQLDHQARGRAMFGFGPGLLPSDARMLGIPTVEQRDRLAEGLAVVLRLLDGETVTERSAWYDLQEASLQLPPFTHPRPEISVASAITPSGGKLAGRHGLSLLCLAASTGPGYDVLDVNWKVANEVAAEHGTEIDRSGLRLVAPFHFAPTRDQAIDEIRDGFAAWHRSIEESVEGAAGSLGLAALEDVVEGAGTIGSVDDGVAALERFWEKTGGFGVMLYQTTPWAPPEAARRSLRAFTEEVLPRFRGAHEPRVASHAWSSRHRVALSESARSAAEKAIVEHFGVPEGEPAL
jgi:limonene 1,2-monooxygenase